jgi:hypothetical protein
MRMQWANARHSSNAGTGVPRFWYRASNPSLFAVLHYLRFRLGGGPTLA